MSKRNGGKAAGGKATGAANLRKPGAGTTPGQFQTGENHRRFTGGRTVNEYGYVRVTTGRAAAKYEHRMVVEKMMLEWAIARKIDNVTEQWGEMSGAGLAAEIMDVVTKPPTIPPGVHIHHINGDRTHNCACNLMLLDAPIHRAITQAAVRARREADTADVMAKLRAAGAGEAEAADDMPDWVRAAE